MPDARSSDSKMERLVISLEDDGAGNGPELSSMSPHDLPRTVLVSGTAWGWSLDVARHPSTIITQYDCRRLTMFVGRGWNKSESLVDALARTHWKFLYVAVRLRPPAWRLCHLPDDRGHVIPCRKVTRPTDVSVVATADDGRDRNCYSKGTVGRAIRSSFVNGASLTMLVGQ
jgi:hypothetical protein